jgi:hypothetical protein
MDHILENEGKPVPDPSAAAPPASAGEPMDVVDGDDEDEEALRGLLRTQTGPSGAVEEAKVRSSQLRLPKAPFSTHSLYQSIKCAECGKIFKNTALANYHAEKSGHDQFEESTEEVCTGWACSCAVFLTSGDLLR